MTTPHVLAGSAETHELPQIRTITVADLFDALAQGVRDFSAVPTHAIYLSLIYPIVGVVLARWILGADLLPLLFPLAAGFALIGPFAATGLYELSRRRERGDTDVSWQHAFGVRHSPSVDGILALGALLLVIFVCWIAIAQAIYVATFGSEPAASIPDFLNRLFTTPEGWTLIAVGNGVGFLFALVVLVISVVSFPLLLDRDVGATVAILTSVRAVAKNPLTIGLWGLIVAALLLLGSLPLFMGLAVVMPILGHATWHLYRKLVEPDWHPRSDLPPPQRRRRRYAAQFPAALLGGEERPPS